MNKIGKCFTLEQNVNNIKNIMHFCVQKFNLLFKCSNLIFFRALNYGTLGFLVAKDFFHLLLPDSKSVWL